MVLTKNGVALEIPTKSSRCSACEHKFQPEESYYSLIFHNEEGLFDRKDYCPECWKEAGKKELQETDGVYWKAKIPPKEEKKQLSPEQREKHALQLLKDTLQQPGEQAAAEAFVLALYLARSRKIFLRKEMQNEGRYLNLYEVGSTEEMIPVERKELNPYQIAEIQKSLADKLK